MLYLQRPSLLDIDVFGFRLLAELLGLSVRAHVYTQIPPRVREHSPRGSTDFPEYKEQRSKQHHIRAKLQKSIKPSQNQFESSRDDFSYPDSITHLYLS